MTLLVLSDTHGRRDRVLEVIALHPEAYAVLFLGDGIRDLPEELFALGRPMLAAVRGNCDMVWGSEPSLGEELLLSFGSYRFLLMHGHRYGVKSGTGRAVAYAAARGADVLLYGHTHVAEERYLPEGTDLGGKGSERPMWVFNPGSLGAPAEGHPSYGLIQIQNGQLLFSHGSL
ncbi:MAG: YfcE family phosphodiesterase [Clostridia bacterium]|nr:YfcE family phosphodiesterase [Clostridia bacterium]